MTRQEKFSKARKNLQNLFDLQLSFRTKQDFYTCITEILVGDIIISAGAATQTYDENDKKELSPNDVYLDSMLAAIGNYDTELIPK